jgi:hypothetical protein
MEDMKKLSCLESCGDGGSFKASIFIESEKFDKLSEELQWDISFEGSKFLQKLEEMIAMEWAKENEKEAYQAHVNELTELFKEAGWKIIYVEVIKNEYCGLSCCYKYPWVIVTTERGRIKLGWRKSVLNLDWSDSNIDADGKKLFSGEDATKDVNYIHCWGEKKAVEYLRKLKETTCNKK